MYDKVAKTVCEFKLYANFPLWTFYGHMWICEHEGHSRRDPCFVDSKPVQLFGKHCVWTSHVKNLTAQTWRSTRGWS